MKKELESRGYRVHDYDLEINLMFLPFKKYCRRKNKDVFTTLDGWMYMYHHPSGLYYYKDSITRNYICIHEKGIKINFGFLERLIALIHKLRTALKR
ncbi:hypothetical protein [Paenibacillus ihuae]|uniref:hypothetical protein n=1 Tax=Paenibacillus ihuae TaxID=1232431 RepID=UPI0006D55133|nr:hypothetical protein [Paenibacillus ihuae]